MIYSKGKIIVASLVFAAVSALAIICTVNATKTPALKDGTWTGKADGRNGPIELSVTTSGGKITDAKVVAESETDFAKPAEQTIIGQAVKKGSTIALDTVSGATITSTGTIAALNAALASASGKSEKAAKYKNTECDIVVIGAGGAGLSAATEAASKGAKVIVLEKMGITGGNTNSATGGLNASETKVQKELGIKDSNEQFYEDTMTGGHNLNDPALVRNMVEKSAATVDWLISLGADLTDVGKMAGSTNKRTHRPQGGAPVGPHLVSVLTKAAIDAGAEIRLNNRVTGIINNSGKPSGVY